MLAAIVVSAVIATVGAVLTILASRFSSAPVAVAFPGGLRPPRAATGPVVPAHVNDPGVYLHTIGLIVLLVGIVGLILSILYWSRWANPGHRSRRRPLIDEGLSGHGYR